MRNARSFSILALAGLIALTNTAAAATATPAEECGKAPSQGKASSLSALERYTKDDPIALREAHPLVHHIGRRSFAFYKDARIAMSHCKDTFWSGCYHGVLEGYLGSLPEIEPRHVVPLCEHEGNTKRSLFDRYNRFYRLGYGTSSIQRKEAPLHVRGRTT